MADMYDEKLKPIIEKALDNYDGITIKDPIVPQRFVGSLNLNLGYDVRQPGNLDGTGTFLYISEPGIYSHFCNNL